MIGYIQVLLHIQKRHCLITAKEEVRTDSWDTVCYFKTKVRRTPCESNACRGAI